MSASNEELAWLKTVFKGFTVEYNEGSYYISHKEREVIHVLLQKLRDNKIKQEDDRAMAMADFILEYTCTGNPCIIFKKDELPLLEGHTFDAEIFLSQLQSAACKPAGSRNTNSSYVASSEGGSPAMWGNHRELSPPLPGSSKNSFHKR